jgi:hypothetical protein
MSDYGYDIDINKYLYMRSFTVTENSGTDQTDTPVLLELNSSNFNFDFARSDGSDLRVSESGGGSYILHSWVNKWDSVNNIGRIWFKVPFLGANETKTLYLFWGRNIIEGGRNIVFPQVSSDDGYSYLTTQFYNTLDYMVLGNNGWPCTSFIRFPGTNITKDETVHSAYIRLRASTSLTYTLTLDIHGNDVGDAVAPLSATEVNALVKTTAKVDWDGLFTWTGGEWYDTPSLSGIVQEVVNRSDWVYGNALQIVVLATTTPSAARVQANSVDYSSGDYRPQLHYLWGDLSDVESGPDEVGLLFADAFTDGYPDSYKWSGNSTVGNPLQGVISWQTIIQVPANWPGDIDFYGSENDFYFDLDAIDSTAPGDVEHNFVTGAAVNYLDIGLESDKDQILILSYYEPTDILYYTLEGRTIYGDVSEYWEKTSHGDVRLTQLHLDDMEVDGVVIKNYLGYGNEPTTSASGLYVPYENVPPQNFDFTTYQDDLTSITYSHTSSSSSGTGDPYKLSDNLYGASEYVWEESVTDLGIDLTISFAAKGNNLVSRAFTHYDDTHVLYMGAAKLSDNDVDSNQNTYWQGITTSGYACIDFENKDYKVGVILVRGVANNLSGMVNNYTIDGSHISPLLSEETDWANLHSGQLQQTDSWQTIQFTNTIAYRYYRLKVLDTYGSNIALREWEMYYYTEGLTAKNVRQLRLKPANFDSNEIYYPKYVSFYGGTLSGTWDELIASRKTYTPYYEGPYSYWQRYSFANSEDYWIYRLTVSGNWGGSGSIMKLAEWEMREVL